jgi:amino acid efflux transporter
MSPIRAAGLGRVAATPLAFGSVAGSGILSLPSAVYAEAGPASLVVWVVAALMCVPMLLMFQDAMRLSADGKALQALVARGLRPWVGTAMPLMFLFVVIVGLPTGCVVAGRYVQRGLGWSSGSGGVVIAGALLAVALTASLTGSQVGGAVQLAGSAALVATGLALIATGARHASYPIDVTPTHQITSTLLPGVLLAFWAFVGFENLTFLGRELRDPSRDFLPVSAAALCLYGGFAVALTLTIAVRVERLAVDPVAGLLDIATNAALRVVVAVVAVSAMLINSAAWVRGVSHLIANAGRSGQLPAPLGRRPLARTALLAVLFTTTLTTLAIEPQLTVDALAAASAVFVLIYLICIVSYLRGQGLTKRTALNAALIPVMLLTLIQSGTRAIYGITIAIACLIWCRANNRTPSRH